MKSLKLIAILSVIYLMSCNNENDKSDAYGNFEATEILVSAESNGKILQLTIEEGEEVKAGQRVGYIDTTQLYLKKQQLIASIGALKSKLLDIKPQVDVLLEQKSNLTREYNRLQNLKKDGAATQKQIDDVYGELEVVDKKILATKTQLTDQNRSILSEIAPLEIQISQVNDQLAKSYIIMPQSGRILSLYAEQGEFAITGRPLLKIGDLKQMDLRVYISGDQLSAVKLGQQVEVLVDQQGGTMKSLPGTISWIASEAEFTPKIVQTKQERVNLVYAVKVKVNNDGLLKIGMPAEVNFNPPK